MSSKDASSDKAIGCLFVIAIIISIIILVVYMAFWLYFLIVAILLAWFFLSEFAKTGHKILRQVFSKKSTGLFFREGISTNKKEPAYPVFYSINGDWLKNWKCLANSILSFESNLPKLVFVNYLNTISNAAYRVGRSRLPGLAQWMVLLLFYPAITLAFICGWLGSVFVSLLLLFIVSYLWGLCFLSYNIFNLYLFAFYYMQKFMCSLFVRKARLVKCQKCKKEITEVSYRCSNCNVIHNQLKPSLTYGVTFHKCRCKTNIPTSDFWGRQYLDSVCSNGYCKH